MLKPNKRDISYKQEIILKNAIQSSNLIERELNKKVNTDPSNLQHFPKDLKQLKILSNYKEKDQK